LENTSLSSWCNTKGRSINSIGGHRFLSWRNSSGGSIIIKAPFTSYRIEKQTPIYGICISHVSKEHRLQSDLEFYISKNVTDVIISLWTNKCHVMNRTYQSWIFLAITARLVTPTGFLLRGNCFFLKPYENCSRFNCVYMFSFGFANLMECSVITMNFVCVFNRTCWHFVFLAVNQYRMLLLFISCGSCLLNAFESHSVAHCNMYNCSGQTVCSIIRVFHDQRFWNVWLIESTILYSNEDLCNRRETSNASNIGELHFINSNFCLLLILWKFSCFVCVFVCFFCFRSPLISCASPWRAGETKNGARPKLISLLH
jgi:hypothetical protein